MIHAQSAPDKINVSPAGGSSVYSYSSPVDSFRNSGSTFSCVITNGVRIKKFPGIEFSRNR